ncbi:MAG: hypothetical protein GU356_05945 [Pyrobaculum sp.]|jgi:hypothetical protein|nr:hypothetical protein [Pyrobaculum sp.]
MWSLAYGLIALAVVAFVVLYAAAHAPSFKTVNLADQLYGAKGWLASNLPSFPKVEVKSRFRVFVNVVRVVKANATAYDYRTRQWVTFPVHLPVGYRLERAGENVVYQIYINVTRCRYTALPRGEPAMLYEIELRHSLDQLPWLDVYAAVPHNLTQYYSWLHSFYTAWRRPPAVGLTPRVGADEAFMELVKAEHVLVYNATSDTAKLYVAAPAAALYVLLVDYPLKLPLTCPEQIASASSESQRSDTPTIDFPSPR